jgi:hypothetical protein
MRLFELLSPVNQIARRSMFKRLSLLFSLLLCSAAIHAQSPYASDSSFRPSEGIWWSDAEPGTGVAFNMDSEGRWFAAIYLYDEAGDPTFVTMQGEALEYAELHRDPGAPWAIAASPIILSEGGQCLQCPWSGASVSDSGLDAEIRFYGRNTAVLRVGDWELSLTPLTEPAPASPEIVRLPFDRFYIYTGVSEPGGLPHVAVIRLPGPSGVVGAYSATFECIICRTVDADGEPDPAMDAQLETRIESMSVFCGPGPCHLMDHLDSRLELFVDKNRRLFSAIEPAGQSGMPAGVIRLQLLDEDWRPSFGFGRPPGPVN